MGAQDGEVYEADLGRELSEPANEASAQRARLDAARQQDEPLAFGGELDTEPVLRGSSIAQRGRKPAARQQDEPLAFGGELDTEPVLRDSSIAQRGRKPAARQQDEPAAFGGEFDTEPVLRGSSTDEPMLYCPVCSSHLQQSRCKLVCEKCGYFMSCADYY